MSEQTMNANELIALIDGCMAPSTVAKARAAVAELVSENETNRRQAVENGKEICRMRSERDALRRRVEAWQARFPNYEYRPQDDCVALKMEPTTCAVLESILPIADEQARDEEPTT